MQKSKSSEPLIDCITGRSSSDREISVIAGVFVALIAGSFLLSCSSFLSICEQVP